MTSTSTTTTKRVMGIDLGTTYSCVGVFENDRVEILANDQGNRTTPSWVAFGAERLVGEAAKNQVTLNPTNTVFDAKRFIGRSFDDPTILKDIKNMSCNVMNRNNKPFFQVEYKDEVKEFAPEEISAMVLGKMKQIVDAYYGEEVIDCVITVPAYFNDQCRQATKDAGVIAGLNVLRIINEPTAAAIAYGIDKKDNTRERNVLIFDFGGGTFDVSLLSVEGGIFEVKATAGDTHLGGEDLDHVLMDYCIQDFKKKSKLDVSGDKKALRRLHTACERAKRTLSSATTATLEIDALYKGIDYTTVLTRAKFEDLAGSLLKKTLDPVYQVLKDAKLSKDQVDDIVLVGGSTRIPKIQQLLKDFFQKDVCTGINPDEAVAYGATIQAAILAGIESKSTSDILLLDVTPLSLGIETAGNIMTTLIPRNSTVPVKKTQIFSTYSDNQPSATIKILEGERTRSADNHTLGVFQLDGIPPGPRGTPQIEVTYDVDANGIITVSATVKGANGVHKDMQISRDSCHLSKEEIERMCADAEKYKADDEALRVLIEKRNRYENALYSYKGLVEKDADLTQYVQTELEWISQNAEAPAEEYDQRFETLMEKIKVYQSEHPAPESPSFTGEAGVDPTGDGDGVFSSASATTEGPRVDEID